MKCKYSILIPAFKRRFLAQAIHSCLAQTLNEFEVIVLDDASPENLFEVVEPFLFDSRVRYYRNEVNIGAEKVVENWNKCLSYSSGEYVICMGDDDELLPSCLAGYDSLIAKYPDLGLYHALTEIIDVNGEIIDMQEARPEFESSLSYIWHRWKGRHQYIGDFCFNATLLKSNGGFFYLPLAWGSDDISAYIAAKGDRKCMGDGVANMQMPGFRYRSFAQTISSSASGGMKLEAKMSYLRWFFDEFRNRDSDGIYLPLLLNMSYEDMLTPEVFVGQDIKTDKCSVFFWLKNRRHYGLSLKMVFLQFVKSLFK